MNLADKIYEAVKPLPETMAREMLDFVEFLRARGQQGCYDNLPAAQASSMHAAWENPDDEIWNAATG